MVDAASPLVLVVSPSPTLKAQLELLVEELGFRWASFSQAREGLDFLKEHTPTAIVLDEGLDPDAFAIAGRLKMIKRLRDVPLVLLVSEQNERTTITAEVSRVDHLFSKPIDRRRLKSLLRSLAHPSSKSPLVD
ncbi:MULTISPECIES: two-component system response regulator [unclassified Meiothermus]|uniref:response regulator n=1 Tax=unclassified Meiothermus TaxID=370471 RepID=UPI000D7BA517|nr:MULTISPECIES: response regulator [unclassified Meiothermus]PZA07303.1 response regulator [Meiothermus sp. Pnk-1]RYM29203.1 response regulator [Meiothermus sp. PNK-Is4]